MTAEEIQDTVKEYAAASKRAIEEGFDGVEVHGAKNIRFQKGVNCR
jgi:2,4-dienoyl-CoA reductase-like NADH-dependent reductase (Old Yellow Enzyme family)